MVPFDFVEWLCSLKHVRLETILSKAKPMTYGKQNPKIILLSIDTGIASKFGALERAVGR